MSIYVHITAQTGTSKVDFVGTLEHYILSVGVCLPVTLKAMYYISC